MRLPEDMLARLFTTMEPGNAPSALKSKDDGVDCVSEAARAKHVRECALPHESWVSGTPCTMTTLAVVIAEYGEALELAERHKVGR